MAEVVVHADARRTGHASHEGNDDLQAGVAVDVHQTGRGLDHRAEVDVDDSVHAAVVGVGDRDPAVHAAGDDLGESVTGHVAERRRGHHLVDRALVL